MGDRTVAAGMPKSCRYGHTDDDLTRILGDRLPEFDRWMCGQTIMICEGREYDYGLKEYVASGCGPHGSVVYGSGLLLAVLPVS